jgi:hypothetical protein
VLVAVPRWRSPCSSPRSLIAPDGQMPTSCWV